MQKACHHELRNAFRALLASSACYHTASVFDPLSARIAADLGFEVGILGGSVASLQVLAAPDVALITLSEFTEQATRIGRVARRPTTTAPRRRSAVLRHPRTSAVAAARRRPARGSQSR